MQQQTTDCPALRAIAPKPATSWAAAQLACCLPACLLPGLICCSCQRVAVAQRTDLPQSLLWCTVYCSDAAGLEGRQRAAAHLAAFLQGELATSALEQQQQLRGGPGQQPGSCDDDGASSGGASEEAEEEEDDQLDDYLQPPAMRRHWQPLITFVSVPELPRG